MKPFDIKQVSNAFAKRLDAVEEAAESQYDRDITDQEINEYFDFIKHIEGRYYNNLNFMLIDALKAIALRKNPTQIVTNDPASAAVLGVLLTMLEAKAIRSIGKDNFVHVIKEFIDRVFSDMKDDLSVHPELIRNISMRDHLIKLNHSIRVKIKNMFK
ncbi:hypothetical protein [Desulfovibrio sp. ZJ200]|uniref:hypothetical protein n=1 Tax=Desulfovibrio sp. ZJ200 TaxID=2709792 RepID=UPI0013ECB9CC|nr:hypothetical protein [Desulfovibrio sp. ZJ200]